MSFRRARWPMLQRGALPLRPIVEDSALPRLLRDSGRIVASVDRKRFGADGWGGATVPADVNRQNKRPDVRVRHRAEAATQTFQIREPRFREIASTALSCRFRH